MYSWYPQIYLRYQLNVPSTPNVFMMPIPWYESWYASMYSWLSSLMYSWNTSHVLNSPQCTYEYTLHLSWYLAFDVSSRYPLMYSWCFPGVLKILQCTEHTLCFCLLAVSSTWINWNTQEAVFLVIKAILTLTQITFSLRRNIFNLWKRQTDSDSVPMFEERQEV